MIMSLDNTTPTKPVRDKTTVEIESADESWALQLINDNEHAEDDITVESAINISKHVASIETNKNVKVSEKLKRDSFISVDENEFDESVLRLSAIENQIFTQTQKQQFTKPPKKKSALLSPISKLKSFFAA